MQYFQDPSGKVYAFDPDVVVKNANGAYSFETARGVALTSLPVNLVPCANNTPPGPTLAQAQATQNSVIAAACATAITAGFTSSAVGTALGYGSQAVDQTNIATAAASTSGGALWAANSSGQWSLTPHTAAQAQQVRSDLWTHIQACQATYAKLLGEIAAATTVAAVEAVVWS